MFEPSLGEFERRNFFGNPGERGFRCLGNPVLACR